MKLVDLEPNSEAWLEWRNQGLGASDAPIVVGSSPWSTPFELWRKKTGKASYESKGNVRTKRGHDLEPIARRLYEHEQGSKAPGVLVENEEYAFLRASLDGWDAANEIILEIKCPGAMDHATAMEGEVPEKYRPQIFHQLLCVPSAKKAHYYSFDGREGVLVEVARDQDYEDWLLQELLAFWRLVQTDTPPPLTSKDFKEVWSEELGAYLEEHQALVGQLKTLQASLDRIKTKILDHPLLQELNNFKINDTHKVLLVQRKGLVDYRSIPEIEGLDLERYRKPSTLYRSIKG